MSVVSKGKKVANLGLQWFRDIYRNRKLILDLANKDFKSRYAASYLGIELDALCAVAGGRYCAVAVFSGGTFECDQQPDRI